MLRVISSPETCAICSGRVTARIHEATGSWRSLMALGRPSSGSPPTSFAVVFSVRSMNSNEAEPSVHSLSVNGVCTGVSFLPTIRGSSCQCMFMQFCTRKIPQGRGIQLSREALLPPLAVAALMTTALSLRVTVGAGFAAITLAVTFHTVILVDFARAVVFTGTLHDSSPSID
jgi:hypothetical protein